MKLTMRTEVFGRELRAASSVSGMESMSGEAHHWFPCSQVRRLEFGGEGRRERLEDS